MKCLRSNRKTQISKNLLNFVFVPRLRVDGLLVLLDAKSAAV
jgi:hypothetical protein